MKKAVGLFLCLLLGAGLVSAQYYKGKARVSGSVVDTQGKPIEGVKVKLFSIRGGQGFELLTDAEGKWKASWLRGGDWNIDFEKVGYMPKKISANFNETQKNPPIEITLEKIQGLLITDELKKELASGNDLFDQGKFAEAIDAYKAVISKYPDAYIIEKNIGNCYFKLEKYDDAEQWYLKVLDKDPKNVDAMLAIGNCYANRGQNAKALEWYGKLEFDKITDPVVLYNIGTNYYNSSKFEDALKYYKKAVELKADFTDGLYQLGLTYLTMGSNPEAISAFESYLKIDPDSQRAGQVKSFLQTLKKK